MDLDQMRDPLATFSSVCKAGAYLCFPLAACVSFDKGERILAF